MDKEELNEEEIQEVEGFEEGEVEDLTTEDAGELTEDEIVELTEEEGEETTGGAVGYGNVQYKCECGANFIRDIHWAEHCLKKKHNKCTIYQQKIKGKNSPGKRIGRANDTRIQLKKVPGNQYKATITYPNGKTDWMYVW